MKIPETFVAIDLETTGLEFEKDEIIEIALVRFVNGKPFESCDFLVKPSQTLRPFIEHLTGITSEDLANAEDFPAIAEKVFSFIGDAPLVAHNAQFDFRFLKNAFARVGVPFDSHSVYDSLALSRIAFQNVANHKLETLLKHLKIERSVAHRALPDAEACGKLFVKAIDAIQKFSPEVLHLCQRLSQGTIWENIFEKNESLGVKIEYPFLEECSALPVLSKKVPFRVSAFFGEKGLLSDKVLNFVERPSQVDFASIVERNMHKGGIAVLEAGTGVGKSLAYLASAALKAVSGERVLISTATKTLQEQLFTNEIPVLQSIFGSDLSPFVLKGRSNYLCLRKFEELTQQADSLLSLEERETFMTLFPWIVQTKTGDISENSGFNHQRNRFLWNKLASEAASCAGENCPFYSCCPALSAKRKAMSSNLLLVNHSLFLSDLLLDFALLPSYEHVVFDEAHRLPSLSAQAFGRSFRLFDLRNACRNLQSGQTTGLLVLAKQVLGEIEPLISLPEKIAETEKALHRFFMKIGKRLGKQKKESFCYSNGILADYDVDPESFLKQLQDLKIGVASIAERLRENSENKNLAKDFDGVHSSLEKLLTDFEFLILANRKDWAFFLEEPYNPHTIRLNAKPLYTETFWKEKFYTWIKSATFVSATLSIKNSLDYFVNKMEMQKLPAYKTPFLKTYPQMERADGEKVVVVDYLPKPNSPEYQAALENLLVELLPGLSENTMVLFTSLHAMTQVYQKLLPVFSEKKKLLLCQNIDGSLENLMENFRKERGACLLGCQILWEGIDLPGDALKNLIIPKLPFPNPVDPFVNAKVEAMKEQGRNVFKELFVPEAFLGLRQGMGRLIRSEKDSGVILLLDNRILTESYGKTFQKIWNEKHTIVSSFTDLQKIF